MTLNFWPTMILIICFVLLCKFLGESSNGRYELQSYEQEYKYRTGKENVVLLLDTKEGLVWARDVRRKHIETGAKEDYWRIEKFEN